MRWRVSGVPGFATACTGLRDLASSRHPDVHRPDYSGYNSPASLFLLPVRLLLKNATAALPGAAPASQGTGSGHAPFLPTYWRCLHKHPPGKPSQQLAEVWHFPQIQQLFPAHSSSATLPTSAFASILTQQKKKDQKITEISVQEWDEPQLPSQGLTKGL